MPDIPIEGVKQGDPYTTKHGSELVPYELAWTSPEGQHLTGQLSQKPETAPPQEGQTLDVTMEIKGDRRFLKKVPRDGGHPGGGGGVRHSEDPKKSAEIRRMASQKCAVALLAVEVAAGLRFENSKASELLKPRIEYFENDAKE